jgi:small basic protein (TIGR04137 family)
MSLDRSLKSANALQRHRNVLSRAERIVSLQHDEKWEDGQSVFNLPKIAHRKVAVGKTKTKKADEGTTTEEGATETAAPAASS